MLAREYGFACRRLAEAITSETGPHGGLCWRCFPLLSAISVSSPSRVLAQMSRALLDHSTLQQDASSLCGAGTAAAHAVMAICGLGCPLSNMTRSGYCMIDVVCMWATSPVVVVRPRPFWPKR